MTQSLDGTHPGRFFDVDIPLDAAALKGKDSIVIRIEAPASGTAGGLFGAKVLKGG